MFFPPAIPFRSVPTTTAIQVCTHTNGCSLPHFLPSVLTSVWWVLSFSCTTIAFHYIVSNVGFRIYDSLQDLYTVSLLFFFSAQKKKTLQKLLPSSSSSSSSSSSPSPSRFSSSACSSPAPLLVLFLPLPSSLLSVVYRRSRNIRCGTPKSSSTPPNHWGFRVIPVCISSVRSIQMGSPLRLFLICHSRVHAFP